MEQNQLNGNAKKGYFFVFLTGVFFSFEVIGFKEIFKKFHLRPEIAAFYGVAIAALIVTPFFLFNLKRRESLKTTIRNNGKVLLVGTFCNAIGIVMYYYALRISDLGPSAVLIKMTVLYNVILGVAFLKEEMRGFEMIGILFAILGIILISSLDGQIQVTSAIIILISAFFFAIQSYLIKRYIENIDGLAFAYLRILLLSFFFACYITMNGSWVVLSPVLTFALGLFSLLGYFLGRAFYFEAHNHLPISKLNSTLLIEPVFLMAIGVLFMHEPLPPKKIMGTVFIMSGLYLLIFHRQRKIK
ncbi:DMT family transporter [Leptospira ognonensis]|uniref:DMT family transporter n=1 Tax=Leptospira ognonensis TaxID=2484945 RepID=UPI00319DB92E